MVSSKIKLYLSDTDGNVIINDFSDTRCQNCILKNNNTNSRSIICPLEYKKCHIIFIRDDNGEIYVCDGQEKTVKNFLTKVELIKHCRPFIIKRVKELKADLQRRLLKELDTFEHNIAHINADAINEFYSFITQDKLVTNYRKLQDLIAENMKSSPEDTIELIARLARYNLNIKTELSVAAKLNNPDSKPSFNVGKPRDAIMSSVYMLYPIFKKRRVSVDVNESWDKFDIDYDALQVASFYIIENASKYTKEGSNFIVSFLRLQSKFYIEFSMKSLFIEEWERDQIFDEGYRGTNAQNKNGKGIGLYRAKCLVHFLGGNLFLEAGNNPLKGKVLYADNKFVIELPVRVSI